MGTARLLTPLRTERLPDGRRELLQDLAVNLNRVFPEAEGVGSFKRVAKPARTAVLVPEGFDTDYSSIPLLARSFMGRWDRHDVAGVVHDYAYRVGVPRGEADAIWRHVARSGERRLGPIRGFLGWAGLRLGGWYAYRQRQGESATG